MRMPEEVEEVLAEYEAGGMPRLAAIREAIREERIERRDDGRLALRKPGRPGRRLLVGV